MTCQKTKIFVVAMICKHGQFWNFIFLFIRVFHYLIVWVKKRPTTYFLSLIIWVENDPGRTKQWSNKFIYSKIWNQPSLINRIFCKNGQI